MKTTKYTRVRDGAAIHSDNTIAAGSYMHGSGVVVREYSSLKASRTKCRGCRDNFYNGRQNIDGTTCWSLAGATVVDKVGYSTLHVRNGPDTIMRKTHSCWHAVSK